MSVSIIYSLAKENSLFSLMDKHSLAFLWINKKIHENGSLKIKYYSTEAKWKLSARFENFREYILEFRKIFPAGFPN